MACLKRSCAAMVCSISGPRGVRVVHATQRQASRKATGGMIRKATVAPRVSISAGTADVTRSGAESGGDAPGRAPKAKGPPLVGHRPTLRRTVEVVAIPGTARDRTADSSDSPCQTLTRRPG